MKKKIIFIFVISLVFSFLIFIKYKNDESKTLIIGSRIYDENLSLNIKNINDDYYFMDISIYKFINILKANQQLISLIHETDTIILSIGQNDIDKNSHIRNEEDINTVLNGIRKYFTKKLYVVNYFLISNDLKKDQQISNNNLKKLCLIYNCEIVDVSKIENNSMYLDEKNFMVLNNFFERKKQLLLNKDML